MGKDKTPAPVAHVLIHVVDGAGNEINVEVHDGRDVGDLLVTAVGRVLGAYRLEVQAVVHRNEMLASLLGGSASVRRLFDHLLMVKPKEPADEPVHPSTVTVNGEEPTVLDGETKDERNAREDVERLSLADVARQVRETRFAAKSGGTELAVDAPATCDGGC